ncbi:ATP-grasp domain-containing protein [Lacrimispora sp.]|uniref:ATP-grasp domain-containing protein n=1 Tax=Lacrimispora sp. TaxID=2719234 RepID=UPI0039E52AFA
MDRKEEIMNTALVTAIGSFSADIVIKNLKKNGIRVIGCDIYPGEWIADSSNVDSFYQVPYATEGKLYADKILEICEQEHVDAILVLTDVEADVLNSFRREFQQSGVTLCLPCEETLSICRDKRKLFHFLTSQGVGTPIPTLDLKETDPEALTYPVVVKPYNGRSSQGLSYIHSKNEMKAFLEKEDLGDFILQPFYKGSIITVDVVRKSDTGETAVVCRKELLRTPNGAGTSVKVFSDPLLEEMCKKIASILGINGCVNFEFIEGEDKIHHMLECNPRFSGGVEFSCMAGYDFVTNHLRCFTGEALDMRGPIKEMYIARKYEEYITKIEEEKGKDQ